MNGKDLRGISVVSFPISKAFSVPISNLLNILSATSETYAIIGTQDQIHFQKLDHLAHIYVLPYQSDSSMIRQMVVKYGILQLRTCFKLFSLRKDSQGVIFFMEFPPLLAMVVAKMFHHKVYWLLPSKILLLSNGIVSKLTAILSRICCNLCNGIILYSSSFISHWNLEKYDHNILIAHEHFLDFDMFTVTTPLPDRPPLIGYIGRLSEEKGILNFAQALPAILSDQQALRALIGGDGSLKETVEASLQEQGVSTRVDLPGWISHDELPGYLNQLRLLVLPSYTEGLPNIMLEAMACGTPVLATPVGAIPDIIIDGKTGFIMENNSPECIAANVVRALSSPDLERIAEDGRRFVEENFSFEKTVENWKRILQDTSI